MKRKSLKMDNSPDAIPNKIALVERNTAPQGISLLDPEAVAKSSERDLIALATEIQKADSSVKAITSSKLQVIAEQMRFLKKQAEAILLEGEQNVRLHHAACNFIKKPGQIYHLYQQETGQIYFSMLSPEEWGRSGPAQTYKGAFRLEQDHSWTPLQQCNSKSKELVLLNKLLPAGAVGSIFQDLDCDIDM